MNLIKTEPKPRVILTVQDVINITRLSRRSAQRLMQKIRKSFKREKRGPVNIWEFSRYMNMELEDVIRFMQ